MLLRETIQFTKSVISHKLSHTQEMLCYPSPTLFFLCSCYETILLFSINWNSFKATTWNFYAQIKVTIQTLRQKSWNNAEWAKHHKVNLSLFRTVWVKWICCQDGQFLLFLFQYCILWQTHTLFQEPVRLVDWWWASQNWKEWRSLHITHIFLFIRLTQLSLEPNKCFYLSQLSQFPKSHSYLYTWPIM